MDTVKKIPPYLIMIIICTLFPNFVIADGGFFKLDVYQNKDLYEPEQKAIIVYDKGKETLIIEPSYEGNVSEFAWVIPVPSYPILKEANSKLFYELHYLTQPKVIEGISPFNLLPIRGMFGKASEGVTIYEQKSVGIFDIAILSSDDVNSLVNWLNENSYYIPKTAQEAIDFYIKKKWYFIALKIRVLDSDTLIIQKLQKIDASISDFDSGVEIISNLVIDHIKNKHQFRELGDLANPLFEDDYPITKFFTTKLIPEFEYDEIYKQYNGYTKEDIESELRHIIIPHNLFNEIQSPNYPEIKDQEDQLRKYSNEFNIKFKTRDEIIDFLAPKLADEFVNKTPYDETQYSKKLAYFWENGDQHSWGENYRKFVVEIGNESQMVNAVNTEINKGMNTTRKHLSEISFSNFIHPVQVSFNSDTIIYPFKITSINPGKTEVLLYVITDYKTKVDGFEMEYANWIEKDTIKTEDYNFIENKNKDYFLTKLRAEFNTNETEDDIIISKADDNKSHHMKIYEGGFVVWIRSVILTFVILYFWILLLSLLPKFITNKIVHNEMSAFYFSNKRFFIYPIIFLVLFLLSIIFPSIISPYDNISIAGFLLLILFYLPILGLLIAIIILHLIFSSILRLISK